MGITLSNIIDQLPAIPKDFSIDDLPAMPSEDVSKTESALRGALAGGTLGFNDEIAGGLGAAGDVLSGNRSVSDIIDAYRQNRDESRAAQKVAEQANPMSYLAGNVGGGLATALIPGAAPVTLGKLMAVGAVGGVGNSEADNIGGVAKDAASGAAIGAVTHGIGQGVNKLASLVKDTPLAEKIARQLKLGSEGVNTGSEPGRKLIEKEIGSTNSNILSQVDDLIKEGATEKAGALSRATGDVSSKVKGINDELSQAAGGFSPSSGASKSDLNKLKESYDLVNDQLAGKNTANPFSNNKQSLDDILLGRSANPSFTAQNVDNLRKSASNLSALGPNALETPEGKKLAGDFLKKYRGLTVEALDPADRELFETAMKKISGGLSVKKAMLGIDDNSLTGLDDVVHENKLLSLISQGEKAGPVGIKARAKQELAYNTLKDVNPALAENVNNQMTRSGTLLKGLEDVQRVPLSGILNYVQTGIPKIANSAGRAYGSAVSLIKQPATAFVGMADQVAGSTLPSATKDGLSNLLKTMAGSNEQRRAALMYGIQQNPVYRDALKSVGIIFGGDSNEK